MATVYLGLGSNLGERERSCARAVSMMEEAGVRVLRKSSLIETEPWGVTDQPRFINMAVEAETDLSPQALLSLLKDIEARMGRDPDWPAWGPRPIDVDILLYDDIVMDSPALTIPHPFMHERAFVLEPLSEIAPGAVHPGLGRTVRELRDALNAL